MTTAQRTETYSRKTGPRRLSPEPGTASALKAIRVTDHRDFRINDKLVSPVITQATQNVGLTLYEMLGIAELARVAYEKGELASVQHRLALLVAEATNLASSIADILELTKIGENPADTLREHFDLVALLHDVSKAARLMLGEKPVDVMDVSCAGPVVLYSDPVKIKQIMMRLMSNAAKFTDRGRITLILGRDDDEIRLTVADTGSGMAAERINAILDSSDQEYDGEMIGRGTSGLGIRIVKTLVKKLDGRISMASKPGEGTIVEVSFPFKST